MSQLSYSNDLARGRAGLIADTGPRRVESYLNGGVTAIQFGRGVARGTDAETQVENIYQENGTITFSADLVAADVVSISINGVAITSTTYGGDHATTMAAIEAKIEALTGVSSSVSGARVISVSRPATDGADLVIVATIVNGGAGTATIALAYTTDQLFAGISLGEQGEDGEFVQYTEVPVMTQGVVWGECVTGQTPAVDGTVYVVSTGANRGKFSTVNDTTTEAVSAAVFKSAAIVTEGLTLAKIEINKP